MSTLGYSFWNKFTSLVEIDKEINCVLLKNAKVKWFKIKKFQKKSEKLSVAKHGNLTIT